MNRKTTKIKNLLSRSLFIGILFLLIFIPKKSDATHVMGSDITWKCLGNHRYQVTLKFYRDCKGIAFSNSKTIRISCTRGNVGGTVNVNLPVTTWRDITPSCASTPAPCGTPGNSGMSGDGVEEHLYVNTIDFNSGQLKAMRDAGCCRFRFDFGECCRNGEITTGGANNNYSTDAEIDICNVDNSVKKNCDDSPDLRNPPIGYLCCNQPFYFNNGVVDIDGDSLAFSLSMSQSAPGTSVNYNSPFNPTTWPMTGYCRANSPCNCRINRKPIEGFCFDPVTGDIAFHPINCTEVGILVVKIDQFRLDSTASNWLYIGYTKRDLQLKVVNCGGNNPPILKDISNPTICEGEEICLTIVAEDEEFAGSTGIQPWKDTIDLTWNNGLPGATFTVGAPSFTFTNGVTVAIRDVEICWQTKLGDGREAPYLFTVNARDKACPRNAVSSRGYAVKVKRTAYAERELTEGDCGKWKLNSIPEDTFWYKGTYQHEWTIRDSTNAGLPVFRSVRKTDSLQFMSGGKYIITYLINNPPLNCPSEYTDTIVVPPLLTAITPLDTFVCEGDTVQIPLTIENGSAPFKVQWDNPLDTKLPKDSLTHIRVGADESKYVSANVTDAKGCIASDTTFVLAVPNPIPELGPDRRICSYDTLFLESNYPEDSIYKFYWSRSNINADSAFNIFLNTPGKVFHRVIDTLGCWGEDSLELFVNKKVIANAGPNKNICIRSIFPINNDTLEIVSDRTPKEFPALHRWSLLNSSGGNVISNDSNFFQSYSNPDSIFYEYYVAVTEEELTCVDADTMNVKIWPLPVITFDPMDPQCFDYGRINLNGADGPNAKPTWLNFSHRKEGIISGLAPFTQFFETDSFPDGVTTMVRADGSDSRGCYNIDSFPVTINPNPIVVLDSGYYCQNANFGPDPATVARIPFFTKDQSPSGIIKAVSLGADRTWRILSAPPLIPSNQYNSLIVNFGNNKALNVGPVGDASKIGWYQIELCATNTLTNCQSCDTTFVEIVEIPKIEFTFIPNQCVNFDTVNLDNFVNLSNGKWHTKSGPANHPDWIRDSVKFMPFKGPGLFELKYVHTASGCYVADSTTINVSALPVVRLDTFSLVCNIDAPRLLRSIIPPNPGANGVWTGFGVNKQAGETYFLDPSTSPANLQFEGPHTMRFNFTHPVTGCQNFDTFNVRIQSTPEIEITTNKPFEQCEFIQFNMTSTQKFANTYTWSHSGDGTFDNNKSLTPNYTHGVQDTAIGQVMLRLETDPIGVCPQARDSVLLLIRPYPQFEFVADTLQGCQPLEVNFTSTVFKPLDGDVSYYWELDSQIRTSTEANPTGILYSNAGDFNVKLVVTNNKGGCETDLMKEKYINVYPNPDAIFSTNPNFFTTIARPRFRMLNGSQIEFGEMFYTWDFGTGNEDDTSHQFEPEFIYDQDTGDYLIRLFVISDKGCVDSTENWVKIGPDVTVYIPNAFSPNEFGPNINNKFYVIAQGIIAFEMNIYNRWGERLYNSLDQYEGWDGVFGGVECKQDVYTYLVKVTGFDGKDYEYSGTVTLLR